MNFRKSTFKITSWVLAFLLVTAGVAQAVDNYNCKGECCQNARKGSQHKRSDLKLSLHHAMEIESLLPFCVPFHKYGDIASGASEQHSCHNETLPQCCKVAQANEKTEGLTSVSMFRTDRLLDAGIVSMPSGSGLSENQVSAVIARYLLPARAAPVPLYLQNSSFLY
ncbi:MAG: hypothetical protein ABIE47_09140 [Pseudomonadota bacterium]